MLNDLEIIAQLEGQIGIELEELYNTWHIPAGYQLNPLQQVINLWLMKIPLIEFPKEILQLSNLQQLNLSGNQLTQLPQEIGQLQNLQELNLSGNQLTQLPQEIMQLQNLQRISLWGNELTQLSEDIEQWLQWFYKNDD